MSNEIIEAEHGDDFQKYVYEDGTTVPQGEPIGREVEKDGQIELVLFEGIFFSPE